MEHVVYIRICPTSDVSSLKIWLAELNDCTEEVNCTLGAHGSKRPKTEIVRNASICSV